MHTWALVLLRKQHLGRCVPRRTAERLHQRPALKLPRKAKVAELNPAVLIQQHVLQLQIAVHDVVHMQIIDGEAQLAE